MDVFECTHKGSFEIGNNKIDCAVLSNKKRIITQKALFSAFNRTRKGERRLKDLPSIIAAKNLLPFITNELKKKQK